MVTYQVHGAVKLRDGLLAAPLGIKNLADSPLVCPLSQLGRDWAQSHIVAGFVGFIIETFGHIYLMF